jgi:hypothetical protein
MSTQPVPDPRLCDCIRTCNRLLREEIIIVGKYASAIREAVQEDVVDGLLKAQRAHERAIGLLRTSLLDMGGQTWQQPSDWGMLADDEGGEALADDGACDLDALLACEERAFERYTLIVANENTLRECKKLIRAELLPATQRNLEILRSVAALNHLRLSRSPFIVRR